MIQVLNTPCLSCRGILEAWESDSCQAEWFPLLF